LTKKAIRNSSLIIPWLINDPGKYGKRESSTAMHKASVVCNIPIPNQKSYTVSSYLNTL
jgi:hypothetical protein